MVDMTLSPIAMLRALVIQENNLPVPPENITFTAPSPVDGATEEVVDIGGTNYTITRNTATNAKVTGYADFIDSSVPIKYQRITLAKLFSEVRPSLFELDILTDADVLSPQQVWDSILAKYKMLCEDSTFSIVMNAEKTQLTLTALDTNLAYIGTVNIFIDPALRTRISNKLLDGFTWDDGLVDITKLNTNISLTPRTAAGKVNAGAYMPLVFKGAEAKIIADTTTDMTELAKLLTKRSGDEWSPDKLAFYSLQNAKITKDGTTYNVKLDDSRNTKIFGTLVLKTA